MLQNALVILRNSRRPILMYGLLLVALDLAILGIGYGLRGSPLVDPENNLIAVTAVSLQLFQSAVLALIMCVCFSAVARIVETGLWKITSPLAAIRRYFGLWFILMLIRTLATTLMHLASGPNPSDEIMTLNAMTYVFLTSWIVPVGAFIMFHGRGERLSLEETQQSFATMATHVPSVFGMVLINFVLLLLTDLAFYDTPTALLPIMAFANALRVMFIFSCAWVICIYHRDHYESDDDRDFDI